MEFSAPLWWELDELRVKADVSISLNTNSVSWQKPSSSLFTANRGLSATEKMVWRHYASQDPTDYQLTWPDRVMQTYSLCLLLLLALALPCSSPHSDKESSDPLCQDASFLYPCSTVSTLLQAYSPHRLTQLMLTFPVSLPHQHSSTAHFSLQPCLLMLVKNSYQTSLSLYAKPCFKSTSRKTKHNITPHKPTFQ